MDVVAARRSVPPSLQPYRKPEPVQGAFELDTVVEGSTVTYTIVLPFLPPSKNVVDNWPEQWRRAVKRKWASRIEAACAEQMIPKGCERVGLAAALVFASARRRDYQNYAQTLHHYVPDALVKCGVLVDDSAGRVEIGPNWGIEFRVDTRVMPKEKKERTILTLAVERAVPRGRGDDRTE